MINEEIFDEALDEIIKHDDEVIVIYSGFSTSIHKFNFKVNSFKEIPARILDIIESKINSKKILFFPSFTANFHSKNNFFDVKLSIDNSNGILSKLALKRNYYRTRQPVHSYLVFGNLKNFKKQKLVSSWGKNSILEFFSKSNARICNLGLEWNKGCAYLHRFEELYEVPWRYNKKITTTLLRNKKKIGSCYEIKYCSSSLRPLNYDYKPFIKEIENSASFCKSSNKLLKFESVKTKCLNKIGKKIFSSNPWIIVRNKKTTLNWIKKEKAKELHLLKN